MRWDKKKLPESSLHVYGKDDTLVMVYNMKRSPKGEIKEPRTRRLENKSLKEELWTLD